MQKKKLKIISLITDKGGSGKTATAQLLGKGLHDEGINTVLYDADQSCNLMNFYGERVDTLGLENVDFPPVKPYPLKLKENPEAYIRRDSPDAEVVIIDCVGKLSPMHLQIMNLQIINLNKELS